MDIAIVCMEAACVPLDCTAASATCVSTDSNLLSNFYIMVKIRVAAACVTMTRNGNIVLLFVCFY